MRSFILFFMLLLLIAVPLLLFSGCVTKDKALGMSDGSNGFIVKVTGSATTGSYPMPEIWLAGNQFSYASSPIIKKDDNVTSIPVFTMGARRSFFGALFGVNDISYTMSYIGVPGETAKATGERIGAIMTGINNLKISTNNSKKTKGATIVSEAEG